MSGEWGDEEIMAALRAQARLVAREEVASLCGLVLRRIQDELAVVDTGENTVIRHDVLSSVFAEALRDFSGTTSEPGPRRAA